MADLLRTELGVEVALKRGWPGEFRVLVNGRVVARKGWLRLPDDRAVVDGVREALGTAGGGGA